MSTLIEAIAAIIAVVLTGFILPYIKTRVSAQKYEQIEKWVKTAVQAAEQQFAGEGKGAAKRNYVLQFLREHGVKLDEKALRAMLESAVWGLE